MRWTKPCWIRKGSTISSIASRGSDSAAAMVSIPTGPPPKLRAIRLEIAAVELVEAERIDLEPAERLVGLAGVDRLDPVDGGEIADPAQEPRGDARRAARAAGDLGGAVRREVDAEDAGAAPDDVLEFRDGVEIEPDRNAEAVAERRGEEAEPGGRADQRERREVDLDRARRRPLADDQVELEVLQRRIEDLLDRRRQAVDLVDEEDVALLEIGEQRGEVAGPGDHRARGRAEIDAELARDDLRQRRLAEAGRADEEDMVERLLAGAGGLDEHLEVGAGLRLADEIGQHLRPERGVRRVVVANVRGDDAAHARHSLRRPPLAGREEPAGQRRDDAGDEKLYLEREPRVAGGEPHGTGHSIPPRAPSTTASHASDRRWPKSTAAMTAPAIAAGTSPIA